VLVIVGGGDNKLGAEYLKIVLGQGNFPFFLFWLLFSTNSGAVLIFEVERNNSILHYRMLKSFTLTNLWKAWKLYQVIFKKMGFKNIDTVHIILVCWW